MRQVRKSRFSAATRDFQRRLSIFHSECDINKSLSLWERVGWGSKGSRQQFSGNSTFTRRSISLALIERRPLPVGEARSQFDPLRGLKGDILDNSSNSFRSASFNCLGTAIF